MKTLHRIHLSGTWGPSTFQASPPEVESRKNSYCPNSISYNYGTSSCMKVQLASEQLIPRLPSIYTPSGPFQFQSKHVHPFMDAQQAILASIIGDEVEKRLNPMLEKNKEELLKAQKEAKQSVITVNGSILSFGRITEVFAKALELAKTAKRVAASAGDIPSTVDTISFPKQLGRSALQGAKGTMRFGAAGLGAAVVATALLAASGLVLDQGHKYIQAVPSSSQALDFAAVQAAKIRVSVAGFEVTTPGTVKNISVLERAQALLAQDAGHHATTIARVQGALSNSYLTDTAPKTIESQKELLKMLQTMQTIHGNTAKNSSGVDDRHPGM